MEKKILGIMLIIAIILLVIIPIAYASESVNLDLRGGYIDITDTGYRFDPDITETAYTGTYNITDTTGTGGTINIQNNSSSKVTFDIVLNGLEMSDIRIREGGDGDIVLNITINGDTTIDGGIVNVRYRKYYSKYFY